MVSGDQWEAVVRNARREAGNKPVLTFNQEHIFVQQLENEVRMNRPSIHVNPNDDPATEAGSCPPPGDGRRPTTPASLCQRLPL